MGNAGGPGFSESDLLYVVRVLDDHRGEPNAIKRALLLVALEGRDATAKNRKLKEIIAWLVKHPENGVCPCNDFKGGVYAAATMAEIDKNADWLYANGTASLDHASAMRRNAARFIAAQPLLFDVGVMA